jgi:hypothetical protein
MHIRELMTSRERFREQWISGRVTGALDHGPNYGPLPRWPSMGDGEYQVEVNFSV